MRGVVHVQVGGVIKSISVSECQSFEPDVNIYWK